MILDPIVNNSLKFQIENKENEEKAVEVKKSTFREDYKTERIFTKRKEILNLEKNIKRKNGIKVNLYFVVLMIFLLGIIVGSITFSLMAEDASIKELVIEKFASMDIENKNEIEIFKKSFERNIKLLATFWIIGISVVGAPLLILLCFYKGFTTAFVISSFLLKFGLVQGNIYVFEKLFLYYLFLIFAVILLTVSSVKVMINVLKYKKDIRLELVRHSIFTMLGLILITISSFVETKFL